MAHLAGKESGGEGKKEESKTPVHDVKDDKSAPQAVKAEMDVLPSKPVKTEKKIGDKPSKVSKGDKKGKGKKGVDVKSTKADAGKQTSLVSVTEPGICFFAAIII